MTLRLVATCGLGLEELLADELRRLEVTEVSAQRGAVTFSGDWSACWRANLWLRTANRVLLEIGNWPAGDDASLARGAGRLMRPNPWPGAFDFGALLTPERTFSIRATSTASRIHDVRWVALKVKDGLVDAQRRRYRRRSSIDRRDPDLPLRVWLYRDQASLLLDTSGRSLDHRGYRVATSRAPVREQLAAACVLAAGWQGEGQVLDPMCGSGTLLAEAASYAMQRPPGIDRQDWAFARLPSYDAERFSALRKGAAAAAGSPPPLIGVDRSASALRAARRNLDRAGLTAALELIQGDAFTYQPPSSPGLLLVNPAYGERLSEDPEQWRRLGDLFKQHYAGWTAVVLAGDAGKGKHIGLRPRRRLPVRNGPIEARILVFDLY